MTPKRICTLALVAVIGFATGCAHSAVDDAWGYAYEENRTTQLGTDEESGLQGLDALTAEQVADRYYRGQRQQATRTAPTIVIER